MLSFCLINCLGQINLFFHSIFLGFGRIAEKVAEELVRNGENVAIISRRTDLELAKNSILRDNVEFWSWTDAIKYNLETEKTYVIWRNCEFINSNYPEIQDFLYWLQSTRFQTANFVFFSSASVYREAECSHDETSLTLESSPKRKVELFLGELSRKKGSALINLRISNVYGEEVKHGFIFECMKAFQNREKLKVFKFLDIERDYLHLRDLVLAITQLPVMQSVESNINIATGKGTKVSEVINLISRVTNHKFPIEFIDSPEFIHKKSVLNCNKLESIIDWRPKVLDEGLLLMNFRRE